MKYRFLIRILTVILAVLLIVGSVGCGDDAEITDIKSIVKPETKIDFSNHIGDLANGNKSDYTIIYSANAGAAVKQAAKEIQDYVLESSGTFVKIAEDDTVIYGESSKVLSLGETAALESSELKTDYSKLKNDGFFIKTENASVFITGKTDRGILYGAYDFIERFIGVKFLSYDYTYVPKTGKIELFATDITDNPAFDDRSYYCKATGIMGDFSSKLRMVNEFTNISEKYGGNLQWFKDTQYVSNYVHNTLSFVEPSKYYASHPEWFYVDMNDEIVELCHAHIGLNEDGSIDESLSESPVKVAIEKLKECIINSDSSIKYFMIGQMDINNPCRCEGCTALETKYKRSGMNIRFVNAVSDAIDKWFKEENIDREIYICTFAYQYSQDAPVNDKGEPLDSTVVPRDNVIVRLAPIRANNYYGMVDERQEEDTRKMLLDWKNVAKKTMIWSYHTRFTFYYTYYPTMQHWQEDLRLYRDMGCQYVFMQSNMSDINDWKANIEAYVASKMLWNPDLNANDLRMEYIKYYYGIIGDEVVQYINNFETNLALVMNSDDVPNMTLQGKDEFIDPKYYGTAFFEKQFELIDNMYLKVEKENLSPSEKDDFNAKIDRLKIYPEFMVLYNYDKYYFDDLWGKKEMLEDFFTTCTNLGITRFREFNGTIEVLKKMWGYIK